VEALERISDADDDIEAAGQYSLHHLNRWRERHECI
jgi:hypothetical protein